ncbi:STAS domain-containing protein [Miltoncostaea marina]|uniref:STAS domain-containing protein n=1 Tax=Miltoncostaea marina TaxID=2843215 RepID=UPI001C3E69D8|nr:STAS domain-containing protein [Miltoncostaea marina]
MAYPEQIGAILRGRLDESSGRRVYALAGEVDVSVAPGLRERLLEVAGEGPAELVLDLSAVEFLDSSGVRALVQVQGALAAAGGRLVLRAIPRAAMRVLEMAAVIDRFDVEPAAGA